MSVGKLAEDETLREILGPGSAVMSEVRRHPERGGWAVFVVASGPLGAHLYVSGDDFVLYESAERYLRDVVDPAIDAALRRGRRDLFDAMDEVPCLVKQKTRWAEWSRDARVFEPL